MDSDSVGVQGGWAMSEQRLIVAVLVGALVWVGVIRLAVLAFDWHDCSLYQEATGHNTRFKLPSSCFVDRGDGWRLLGG